MTQEEKNCIIQAERYLTLREHNKFELINKLKEKKYSQNVIDAAISYLLGCNELNEERYIRAFVRSNNNRHPEGKNILYARLIQKGADKELSKQILDQIYSEEYENQMMEKALASKICKSKDPQKDKILSKMVNSGFKLSKSARIIDKSFQMDKN